MLVNADRPLAWKADVTQSIQCYNDWCVQQAPQAYLAARLQTAELVEAALRATANLTAVTPDALRQMPHLLSYVRMAATPPLSRERLAGLAGVSLSLLATMEREGHIPPQLIESVVDADLHRIGEVLMHVADRDIFPWLANGYHLTESQIHRAALIVADRLCVARADAIIRDAQKQWQLAAIRRWLERRGYAHVEATRKLGLEPMNPGTFSSLLTLPVHTSRGMRQEVVPIDLALMPTTAGARDLPLLIAVHCAGDVEHGNKKRAEDAATITALRSSYGPGVRVLLVLWGYFDTGYLGHAAAEGLDWIWQHRLDDLAPVTAGPPALAEPRMPGAMTTMTPLAAGASRQG